jgi:NAD(P)-dependent dehydrogenase (short-subunit alcohol dehydrogenase family)
MLRGLMTSDEREAFGRTLPIGRLGTPAEIADAALFLAGSSATFLTGAILSVDGGQTALV